MGTLQQELHLALDGSRLDAAQYLATAGCCIRHLLFSMARERIIPLLQVSRIDAQRDHKRLNCQGLF
jgi:uncharacterized protein involved in response to NO